MAYLCIFSLVFGQKLGNQTTVSGFLMNNRVWLVPFEWEVDKHKKLLNLKNLDLGRS